MPELSITRPAQDARVVPFQPFVVTGRASDVGMPEPHVIDAVTVQIDAGPVIDAALTRVPDRHRTVVDYAAAVEVTDGPDPHTVTVTATNDNGISAVARVQVFAGPIFHAAAPSILVELLSPVPFDPGGPLLTRLASQIQYALIPAADLLAGLGMVLAGPNLATGTDPSGLFLLRLGIWIQPAGFPVVPAAPPAFPLPRLNGPGAQAGFALAGRLPVPLNLGLSFAASVPTAALQSLIDAVYPQVKSATDSTFATLDAIRAGTAPPLTVSTTVHAHTLLGIPVTVTLTETLGVLVDPDLGQSLPAVTGHDSDAGAGDVLDWILGALLPPFGAALLAITAIASSVASDASGQVHGVAGAVVAGIPPRIPVRTTDLGVAQPPFPTVVPDWKAFGTTADGILGTGTAEIRARDQSTVAMAVDGTGFIEGSQSELAGGTGFRYDIALTDIDPDPGAFTWQVTGAGTDTGPVTAGPFGLGGTADVLFPLPLHVAPGEYDFVLTVTATETCSTDPAQTLHASTTQPVRVRVKKDPVINP